jgi:hypothetical protein
MMVDDVRCFWIMICNPTDPSSEVKRLSDSGNFAVMNISALNHPNVLSQLSGGPEIIRGAVTLRLGE